MSTKDKHIVFRVINFLHSDFSLAYKLLPIDKFILVTLASHNGLKGIFPSKECLANELHVTLRYTRERLKHLEKQSLISVQKKRNQDHYQLLFLSTGEEPQFPNTYPQEEPQFRERGTTVPPKGTTVPPYISIKNKVNNKRRTKEADASLSFLFVDFEPNRETIKIAAENGLTEREAEEVLYKFREYYVEKRIKRENWQAELQEWYLRKAAWKHEKELEQEEKDREESLRNRRYSQGGTASAGIFLSKLMNEGKKHMEVNADGLGDEGQGAKTKVG